MPRQHHATRLKEINNSCSSTKKERKRRTREKRRTMAASRVQVRLKQLQTLYYLLLLYVYRRFGSSGNCWSIQRRRRRLQQFRSRLVLNAINHKKDTGEEEGEAGEQGIFLLLLLLLSVRVHFACLNSTLYFCIWSHSLPRATAAAAAAAVHLLSPPFQ